MRCFIRPNQQASVTIGGSAYVDDAPAASGRHGAMPARCSLDRRHRPRRGQAAQDFPPVPRRHDRQRRLPRPDVPALRRRARQAHQRRADGRGLSQLLAGQDRGAILGDPPRCARHDALSAELRRRRGQRIQYRLHAGRDQLLRSGLCLEEGRDRQAPDRTDGREGRDLRHLAVAGRRRRPAATPSRSSCPRTSRARRCAAAAARWT